MHGNISKKLGGLCGMSYILMLDFMHILVSKYSFISYPLFMNLLFIPNTKEILRLLSEKWLYLGSSFMT